MLRKNQKFIMLLLGILIFAVFVGACSDLNKLDKGSQSGQDVDLSDDNKEQKGGDEDPASVSFPLEIVDSLDRVVVIDKRPERIISLAPNTTETIFALGLGDTVIGVSNQCDYPKEATEKKKVGDFWEPSIELVVAEEPDLLFVGNKATPDLIEKLEESNIKVISLEGESLKATYDSIIDTGKIMGEVEAAKKLVDSMKEKEVNIGEKVKELDNPKCYFAVSFGEWGDFTAGAGSFIDEMISIAGGENIAGDIEQPWPEYSLEKLIEKNPEVIFVTEQSGGMDIAETAGYKELPAVKEGRIVVLDDNLVSRPGPRLVEGLEEIAKGLHFNAFK